MDNFPSMDLYAIRMTKMIGLAFILVAGGGFIYFRNMDGAIFALGAAVCCVSNIVKIYWLKNSVTRATAMDATYAVNYVRGQAMMRMLFTLAVLVGAGFLSQLEALGLPFLMGAIFGLLSMPLAGYSMSFFARRDYQNSNADKGDDADV